MIKKFILFSLLFCFELSFSQFGDIQWNYTYGGSGYEEWPHIIQLSEGGYLLVGSSTSNNYDVSENHGVNHQKDIWIVKLANDGQIVWEKSIGGSDGDLPRGVQQTEDGGFIIIGETFSDDYDVSYNIEFLNLWLVKLSSNGEIEWEKTLFNDPNDGTHEYGDYFTAGDIKQTDDGGYIITAGFDADCLAIKTNATGDIEWTKKYGDEPPGLSEATQTPSSIAITDDGGYIISGEMYFTNPVYEGEVPGFQGFYDFYVLKLNSQGDLDWQRAYGGSEWERANKVIQTQDGNYIVVGFTSSTDGDVSNLIGSSDVWVVKLNQEGEIIWEKTYGSINMNEANDVIELANGNLLVLCFARQATDDVSENFGLEDYWLIEISSTGELLREKSYGGNSEDIGVSLAQTQDNGLILAGTSNSLVGEDNDNHGYDFWVIKLGDITADTTETHADELVTLFPNPITKLVYFNKPITDLSIYTLDGKLISQNKVEASQFDLSKLSNGTYILQGHTKNGKVFNLKIIKN